MADDIGPFAGLPGIFAGAFGEPVSYINNGGVPITIAAIFQKTFSLAQLADGPVEGYAPELHVRADDVPEPLHGDTAVVRGTTFQVVGVEPDGHGMIRLVLMEA